MSKYDWPPTELRNLTELEAFDAMRAFVHAYWERGLRESDELANLLSDVERSSRGGPPLDPVQWPDWQAAVDNVVRNRAGNSA